MKVNGAMKETELENAVYIEVQRFYENRIMAVASPVLILIFIATAVHILTNPLALPGILLASAYIGTAALVVFICFYMRLVTIVTPFCIEVRFIPFVTRIIPFADIEKARIKEYRAVKEFGGWGIRCALKGKISALTISGNSGLELQLEDGKRLLIGTKNPKALSSALIDKIPISKY